MPTVIFAEDEHVIYMFHKSERKARKSDEHTISQQMPGKCVEKRAIVERESPSETKKKWIYLLEPVEIGLDFSGYILVLKTHKNSSSFPYSGSDALTFKIMIVVSFNDAACWNTNHFACTLIEEHLNFMNWLYLIIFVK